MLAAFLLLAFAASLAGGLKPAVGAAIERLGAPRVLSFRSGLLIAAAVADVLPEALRLSPVFALAAAAGALALGWRLHGTGDEHAGHEHTHPHLHGSVHLPTAVSALFAHSLLDGINLGSIALVGGPALLAVGAATTLHKFADGFSTATLFHERPRASALAALLLVSLATPLGALLAHFGGIAVGPRLSALLLGFAGGSFLYVGCAQIVPQLLRVRDVRSAASFGAGLGTMILLR